VLPRALQDDDRGELGDNDDRKARDDERDEHVADGMNESRRYQDLRKRPQRERRERHPRRAADPNRDH
jgi:hypothetical protein